ncbi:hypothetical protein Ancab_028391 [Ancistrocladus abbreviatus]
MAKVENFVRESKCPHYDKLPLLVAPGSSVCPLTSENHATTGKGALLKLLENNDDRSCQQNGWGQGVQQENMGCALMEDRTTTSRRRDKSVTSEHPPVKPTETNGPGLVCSKPLTCGDPSGPCSESGSGGKSQKGPLLLKGLQNPNATSLGIFIC